MRFEMRRYAVAVAGLALAGAAAADAVRIGEDEWQRTEWRASTFGVSSQAEAALAVDHEGNIVVVWSSRRQQVGQYGVYAQRFDPKGVAIGQEQCVNLWTQSHQLMPVIATRQVERQVAGPEGEGRTVRTTVGWVAWMSHGQDGHAGSIVARRFEGSPADGGSEILVNRQWEGQQLNPVLAVSPGGGALIVWESIPGAGGQCEIRGRLFDATGKAVGDEFAVSAGDGMDQRVPAAAFASDGTFAVAYSVFDRQTRDPVGICLRRFDGAGKACGEPVDVCGGAKESQIEPVIAATREGYVVAWLDAESDGSDYGVLARRFDRAGKALGEPFVVNAGTEGSQNAAVIAVAPDGRFVIAYNGEDGDKRGVFGQMFAADGTRVGKEFRINAHTAGEQRMRPAAATQRLAFTAEGALLCAWDGDGGFGDRSSANVTMLSPKPVELAGKVQGVRKGMKPARTPTAVALADGPGPHIPPTFDPRTIARVTRREIVSGRGEIGFTAIDSTGWTPPDPHLAVGPEHVVVITNGAIAFFEKDGTKTFQDEIEDSFGFWGSVGATGFVFDPEVLYDELSGRFFAMAAEGYAPGNKSYVLVAVSDDSDPNGEWYKYRFDTSGYAGYMFDSPNIGVDADVVYITGDAFGLGPKYPVYTYDKASLLAGDPPAITNAVLLDTSTQSAGIPPVTFDDPPALYMCEHKEGTSNTSVRMIAMLDPLGTPSFKTVDVTVPAYGAPEDPPQKGTSSRPETFDARFWCVAYRNGSLWATQHINGDRVLARWYEFAMNGWPLSGEDPELVQWGNMDPGPGIRTFFCSITVDDHGNAAMCYARSSTSEYISMETSYRYKSDPLDEFQPGIIRKESTGPYTSGRWGDYSQVNVDPTDGITMWAHHEWASGGWHTWVQGWTPEFASADVTLDGIVDVLDLLGVLADWGPCPGCPTDITGDGVVDVLDLLEVLAQWG